MKYLIFDTETSGLIKNSLIPIEHQARLIEFFGHIVDEDGQTHEELEFMVDPGIPISDEITKITGIKPEDVIGKPRFIAEEGRVRAIIGRADAVVAHNLSYDWDIINTELRRCGTADKVKWPVVRICTVQETEWIKGHRLSLSALHEHLFGEPFAGAHRARVDVAALTRCFLELKQRGDL